MRGAGMIDRIVVSYPELCTGCRQCELTCSYVHEGVYSPGLSRIRLVRFEGEGLSVPVTCVYCRRPYCEEVCPTGAMTHDPQPMHRASSTTAVHRLQGVRRG